MASVTVTAKIPKELRTRLKQLSIPTSPVMRRALEEEVRKRELVALQALLDEAAAATKKKISRKEIVRLIREDREAR